MSYPAQPRQRREALVPKLAQVIARIEASPSHELEWKWDAFFGGGTGKGAVTVEALYVFGSFARGAPSCGDLDLIVAVRRVDGLYPPERLLVSKVKGRLPNIDLAIAFDEGGLAGKLERFPEARLVWSQTERDWRAHLDSIVVDPSVGHFPRKTDRFPLSLKQIAFWRLEHAEAVADRIDAGELVSTWVPLESIKPDPESWDPELQRMYGLRRESFGRESTVMLPFVLQWMSTRLDTLVRNRFMTERACLHINDMHAHIGRPALDVEKLDRIDTSTMILAPHRSARSPEGVWVLERGPNHPLVKSVASLSAWVEEEGGEPFVGLYSSDEAHYFGLPGIDLFRDKRQVASYIRRMSDDPGERPESVPLQLSGEALLKLLAKLHVVYVGGEDLVVRGDGDKFVARLRELLAPPRNRARNGVGRVA